MSEKPDTEDFDDPDADELLGDGEDLDLERVNKDLEHSRKRAPKGGGDPAWRRLEDLREQKRLRELTSDFDDYDIGLAEPGQARKSRQAPRNS
jgi:hypothetical protein